MMTAELNKIGAEMAPYLLIVGLIGVIFLVIGLILWAMTIKEPLE